MKMTLDMTFEDGKKVLDALRDCAINNGWEKDELDESGIMEEYTAVVDAALTAIGIYVSIDSEPEDADENKYCDSAADCYFCKSEDEDEDEYEDEEKEEEDTCQYSLTPKGEFVVRALDTGMFSFEEACNIANVLFSDGEGE